MDFPEYNRINKWSAVYYPLPTYHTRLFLFTKITGGRVHISLSNILRRTTKIPTIYPFSSNYFFLITQPQKCNPPNQVHGLSQRLGACSQHQQDLCFRQNRENGLSGKRGGDAEGAIISQALADVGLPNGKTDLIELEQFTFDKFYKIYQTICPRLPSSSSLQQTLTQE